VTSTSVEDSNTVQLTPAIQTLSETSIEVDVKRNVMISGSVNVFTSSDAYIYVYIDDTHAGIPFYVSVRDVWTLVPINVLRSLTPGRHRISIRGSCAASNAKAGTRVLVLMLLGPSS